MIHEPLSTDPDVLQAIEDFRDVVVQLNRHIADARRPGVGERAKAHFVLAARDLQADIALRCERLDISAAALVELINLDIDRRSRRGRQAPARATSRTVFARLSNAIAKEDETERAMLAAQRAYGAARAERIAAEEAQEAFSAGRMAA